MKKVNLTNVQEAKDSKRLPAGGYVCKYTKVEDRPEKEYLYMEFDIARGDFANYYKDLSDAKGFWGGSCYRSYKEKALPMFKRMCSAVSKSNNGFVFDGDTNADETTLIGKLVGLVLCEEEYVSNDGNIRTRLYVDREMPVEDIINGKFKVRPLKKLKEEDIPSTEEDTPSTASADGFITPDVSQQDLPF